MDMFGSKTQAAVWLYLAGWRQDDNGIWLKGNRQADIRQSPANDGVVSVVVTLKKGDEPMTTTYRCQGFQNVEADTVTEAAKIFASRAAHRAYGRKGFVMACREDQWSMDQTCAHYEATIAQRLRPTSCATGRRIWLFIYPQREARP